MWRATPAERVRAADAITLLAGSRGVEEGEEILLLNAAKAIYVLKLTSIEKRKATGAGGRYCSGTGHRRRPGETQ